MGFYKKTETELMVADNFVYSPTVTLKADEKDIYQYPQDGWYWFNTLDEAISFFHSTLDTDKNSLTPRQIRLILLKNELLFKVETLVSENSEFKIYWEYSLEVNRNDDVLIQIANALGISDEMLDSMFIEGSKL